MSHDTIVGLDVHADSITAAILQPEGEHPEVIKLSSDLMKVRRLFRRLSEQGPVRSCYEASGAGFVLQRALTHDGFSCEVIAPSLIPRKPGDHRKTNRLDAVMLARLYRSGHLTSVHVPTEDHEALRRLLRLRTTYHAYITATMHRISGILRNHGFVFTEGKSTWTKKHRTALTLLCEVDDVRRFSSPRKLMAYFGLVPSEYSSGEREHRGPITKAGNIHVRRLLVEAAWNNRHRAAAALILNRRRLGQPPEIVAIALKAQHRLSKKFFRLDQRKHRHVAVTAVARELCGFVWVILMALPKTQH